MRSVRSFDQAAGLSNLLGGKEDKVFPRCGTSLCAALRKTVPTLSASDSTTMHQAGEYLAANLPVPVVNPGPLTYKLVETFLALGLSHGRDVYPARRTRLDMLEAMMKAGAKAVTASQA